MMKICAIIGSTASGKTALAEEIAEQTNSVIVSLDSLSVYKYIDIASAKPEKESLEHYHYFGVNVFDVNEPFNVSVFIECFKKAEIFAKEHNKNIIIVGGTGFYLQTLIEGLSPRVNVTHDALLQTTHLFHQNQAYQFLQKIDSEWASKLSHMDTYRTTKALELYFSTGMIPSKYYETYPKQGGVGDIPIFEIIWDKQLLKNRIQQRTEIMVKQGLVDEVVWLEKNYSRTPLAMKAIGIKEVLAYCDGLLTFTEMKEQIVIHTAQLAKRQRTFNASAFPSRISDSLGDLKGKIFDFFAL